MTQSFRDERNTFRKKQLDRAVTTGNMSNAHRILKQTLIPKFEFLFE